MSKAIISLGSNLGDRLKNLANACDLIGQNSGTILKRSSIYETESWGYECLHDFLNQVIIIESQYSPGELLNKVLAIEKKLGRVRSEAGDGSRIIDIDLLFYEQLVINSKDLYIPHPRLHLRKFTLIPLTEIAGDFIHPVLNVSLSILCDRCGDDKKVNFFMDNSIPEIPVSNEI
jgi:2-amino-4-hydroxy-6-hydroxymethyldihydropteridine diphosphokinase